MYFPRLVTLIALLGSSIPAFAAPAAAETNRQAYTAQDRYGYCDATLIAGLWGQSVSDAKVTIGYKIINGYTDMLDSMLSDARRNAMENPSNRSLRCSYGTLGYSYEDAKVLAKFWGQDDPYSAKLMIEQKYLVRGSKDLIDDALRAARGASTPSQPSQPTPMDAYFSSRYEYCDAAALASMWQQSVSEAKATIGQKILSGLQSNLDTLIPQARSRAKKAGSIESCTY